MNSSRRFPWMSGLIVAFAGALLLIADVANGVISVLSSAVTATPM